MGQRFRGARGHIELFGRNDPRSGQATRDFAERDEALRFLRNSALDSATLGALRRWAYEQGLHVGQHQGILERLATELSHGTLHLGTVTQSRKSSGGEKPKPETPDKPKPAPPPKPKPTPPPKPITELVVTVKDEDGKLIEGAKVVSGAAGTKTTNKEGVADFGKVEPGKYDITAEKGGHSKKKNDPVGKDEKKQVDVPEGSKTQVELCQHPSCANVAFFEGPTTRQYYFGFDHKTNLVAAPNGEYWKPVPDRGTLTMPGNKLTRDAARWVSVAVGQQTQLEINFDFKGTECIPCIENSTFEVVPANIAEVVTASVSGKKAAFKIKGKAVGEASLKVICDGQDLGWFHIWCVNEATLKLDIACLITNRAPVATYNMGLLRQHFEDIYRQACIKIDMVDLGSINLTSNAPLATIESSGYPAGGGVFLAKSGTPRPYNSKGAVLNALHGAASTVLGARTTAPLARAGAYRLYWYVPTVGCSILGTVLNIGSNISFGFQPDSSTARNSTAHEFGHSLNLRHPSDGSSGPQFAAHNLSTRNVASPAYTATNTEPASTPRTPRSNVMANDPTNLMGYWPDRPNRKRLRYHQWKAASRS